MSESIQKWILRITGGVTLLAVLQWIAPELYLQTNGLVVNDAAGLLYARHWGLMAFAFGLLIVTSAYRPALRPAVISTALIEKAGLVWLVMSAWDNPAFAGLRVAACFDAVCVVLYAIMLGLMWRLPARAD